MDRPLSSTYEIEGIVQRDKLCIDLTEDHCHVSGYCQYDNDMCGEASDKAEWTFIIGKKGAGNKLVANDVKQVEKLTIDVMSNYFQVSTVDVTLETTLQDPVNAGRRLLQAEFNKMQVKNML